MEQTLGPLGREATDAQGRDQKGAAVPKEIAEFRAAGIARDLRQGPAGWWPASARGGIDEP